MYVYCVMVNGQIKLKLQLVLYTLLMQGIMMIARKCICRYASLNLPAKADQAQEKDTDQVG